jgi:hypothetical protein
MPIKKLPNSGHFSRKISNPTVSSEKDMGKDEPGGRENHSLLTDESDTRRGPGEGELHLLLYTYG